MADETRYNARDDRAAPRRAAGRRFASRRALPALLTVALLLALIPLAAFAASPAPTANRAGEAAAQQSQGAFTSFDDAGDSRDLGAMNPKDYMTVSLTLAQQSFVRVSFTGYAYAKSSAAGVQTPGCPCLVRGELRVNEEARQIVTRQVVASDANDIVGDPNATPAVAAADRRDFSGSHVYSLAPGTYSFTMSMRREVGMAQNVGFAFGRMQAEVIGSLTQDAFTSFDDAGDSRDLGGANPKDYMSVRLNLAQPALVRASFTGYAYAKASGGNVQTPGCPCLVRGQLRVNDQAQQVVTRTVLATDANDVVADPNATPPVAAADRADFSGSHVFELPAGSYTFTMSMAREVGTAQNVGFAFGRMQAEILPPPREATATLDGAGADRDLAGTNPKDYMTVTLNLAQPAPVRVSFTGYAFAKASGAGVQTPGCPCLVRGELRVNNESRQIVTRTVLATEGDDVAGDPNATPAVAAADRRDFSGSHVYELAAGTYTFTMSMRREVGTADNVGFAFGRMQAQVLSAGAPAPAQPTPAATVPAQPTATMAATATPRPQPTATTAPVPTATMVMPGLPATGAGASSAAVATDRSRGLLASLALVAVVVGVAFALRRRMA